MTFVGKSGNSQDANMSLPFITARPVLSVVVPMHDEADNLAGLFERLGAALDRVGLPYEVICIDDGSADHTLPRLKAQRQRDPRVKVISFGLADDMGGGLSWSGHGDFLPRYPLVRRLQFWSRLIASNRKKPASSTTVAIAAAPT